MLACVLVGGKGAVTTSTPAIAESEASHHPSGKSVENAALGYI